MTDSPFRLLPWEHGGTTPAPSRVMQARVEGALRRFEVKWRAGRAFFRLADSDDNRVWASWHNIGETEFAVAVEAGDVGRYYVVSRGFSTQTVSAAFEAAVQSHRGSYDLFGRTSLAVIVTDENRGRAQEWCGGPWLDFELPPRPPSRSGARKPSVWHRGWNVVGLRGALANLAGELAFRPFAPDVADSQELTFVCGSAQQLLELYQAAQVIFVEQFIKNAPWRANYSPRRSVQRIEAQSAQGAPPPHYYYVYAPPALLVAFVQYNLPVGGEWKRAGSAQTVPRLQRFLRQLASPPATTSRRIDYRFEPHSVTLDFALSLDPSAHEQLEARLFLRDWMRDTLPATQFERLKKYIET